MFVIVDGSYFCARSHSRLSHLSNSDGFPTGSIYGTPVMISGDFKKINPDYAVVVFDSPSSGIPERNKIYAEYKANRRPKTKKDKEAQKIKHIQRQVVCKVLSLCGIPSIFAHDGWEADDTIASLAVSAAAAGQRVLILTGDKDIAALVSNNIRVLDTKRGEDDPPIKDYWKDAMNPLSVEEKFGVPPSNILDLLALSGDEVDGIPGIPGITREKAAKLVKEYGSLKNIHIAYSNGELKLPAKCSLLGDKTFLKRNLKLVKLNTELIQDFDLSDYKISPTTEGRAEAEKLLIDEYQFKGLPKYFAAYLDDVQATNKRPGRKASMFS